jgi:hypothetical protein
VVGSSRVVGEGGGVINIFLIIYRREKWWFMFRHFLKIAKSDFSFVMSVCPSFRIEELGSHWRDFDET